jgi:hypothetical protein
MSPSPEFKLDVPEVIGRLSEQQIALKLEAAAQQRSEFRLEGVLQNIDLQETGQPTAVREAIRWPWNSETRCWQFTDHAFGYLPLTNPGSASFVDIADAGSIAPDIALKDVNLRIRLDRLRVFEYPGDGVHNILFGFSAAHKIGAGAAETQDLRFNQTYPVLQGSGAGVRGYPIFDGLRVAPAGVAFECTTVNVSNADDNKLSSFLNSDVLNKGMTLLNSFNPIIPVASSLATGILKAFAGRYENITVQHFQLGLDLDAGLTGARLREGSYIAVQVERAEEWDWSKWTFDLSHGAILSKEQGIAMPLNYVVFRVNRVAVPETTA